MNDCGRGALPISCTRAVLVGTMVVALSMLTAATGAVIAQEPSPASSTPSPGWTPGWTPAPPDATHVIVRDTFDAPGEWWTGSDDIGTSRLVDGGLRWTIDQDRRSIWDTPELPRALDEVRVEATVLVEDGSGGGGPLCAGADTGERAIWAGVNGDGEWIVGRIADTHVQVIERGETPIVRRHDVPVGAPYPVLVTLECIVDPEGADHYTVWFEGVQVADVVDEPVGPFLRAGLVATADEAGLSILFDDYAVFGGSDVATSPAPSARGAPPSPGSTPGA